MAKRQWTVGKKLALSFAVTCVFMAILGGAGYFVARNAKVTLEDVGHVRLPSVESVLTIALELERIAGSFNTLTIKGLDPALREKQYESIAKSRENYEAAIKKYESLPKLPEETEAWKQAKQVLEAWEVENNKALDLSKTVDALGEDKALSHMHTLREQLLGPVTAKKRELFSLLAKLLEINKKAGHEEAAENIKFAWRMQTVVGGVALFGLVFAVLLGTLVTRGVNSVLQKSAEALGESADQVASAAGQVSSASEQLAEGASEQAAGIEETSSSVEEMASMTRQNADNAAKADALMKEAAKTAEEAKAKMEELLRSMEEVTRSSEETQKIIRTIDEIAFQTNLLALNAAVEAARAGEAGAGFAVVADEVRNLAMRAADAAKNTAELIESTVVRVKQGANLTGSTNQAFDTVHENVVKVAELVNEIAAASHEQSEGISQINTAISEMDKVVQQNAANAEESASAAEELSAQAEQMRSHVKDLVALVGRRGDGAGFKSLRRKRGKATSQPKALMSALESSGQSRSKGEHGKAHSLTARKPQQKKPEELIPFDEDFSGF